MRVPFAAPLPLHLQTTHHIIWRGYIALILHRKKGPVSCSQRPLGASSDGLTSGECIAKLHLYSPRVDLVQSEYVEQVTVPGLPQIGRRADLFADCRIQPVG